MKEDLDFSFLVMSVYLCISMLKKEMDIRGLSFYSMNRPLYTTSVVKELYSKMKELGKGEEDFCSIYQLFK